MLIIDDCSSDNSLEIIKEFVRADSRIRFFQTDAKSGSPALPRNIGIENARGKYISFLDADDIWLPDKLKHEVEFAEKIGCCLVYSYYEKMDWQGNRANRIVKTREVSTYHSLLKSNSIPCLTSMVSREIVGNTRFKNIPQEDFCFWLDILKKGYAGYNLGKVTALYREARNSRSARKIDMFKGYWNVIRNHQNIKLIPAFYYMTTYSVLGIIKYLK